MAISLIDKIKQKNNGEFKLAEQGDIENGLACVVDNIAARDAIPEYQRDSSRLVFDLDTQSLYLYKTTDLSEWTNASNWKQMPIGTSDLVGKPKGNAVPVTDPTDGYTPANGDYWVATEDGTYTHFDSIVIASGEEGSWLYYNGTSFIKVSQGNPDNASRSATNTFTGNNTFTGSVTVPLSTTVTDAARVNEVNAAQSTADTAEANAATAQAKADENEGNISTLQDQAQYLTASGILPANKVQDGDDLQSDLNSEFSDRIGNNYTDILNLDNKTKDWAVSDTGLTYPTTRVYNSKIYRVIDGQTSTSDNPETATDIWEVIGGSDEGFSLQLVVNSNQRVDLDNGDWQAGEYLSGSGTSSNSSFVYSANFFNVEDLSGQAIYTNFFNVAQYSKASVDSHISTTTTTGGTSITLDEECKFIRVSAGNANVGDQQAIINKILELGLILLSGSAYDAGTQYDIFEAERSITEAYYRLKQDQMPIGFFAPDSSVKTESVEDKAITLEKISDSITEKFEQYDLAVKDEIEININKAVGTVDEKALSDTDNVELTQDADSPVKDQLNNCIKANLNLGVDVNSNDLFLNDDINSFAYSLWLNISNLTLDVQGLYITIGASAKFTDNSTTPSSESFKIQTSLDNIGVVYTRSHDGGLFTSDVVYRTVEKVGDWYKFIINFNNIVWKEQEKTLDTFKLYYGFNFTTSGYKLIQNATFLASNKQSITVNESTEFIYKDGLLQLQYPYNTEQLGEEIVAQKAKQVSDNNLRIAENGVSPLTGKNCVFIADSLGAATGEVNNDGLSSSYVTFDDLDESDKDLNAQLLSTRVSKASSYEITDSDYLSQGVGYPYWISKFSKCKAYDMMQSGWLMVNGFANDGYDAFRYQGIGKVIRWNHDLETHEVLKNYDPNYIIFSFGTNDNTPLGSGAATIGTDLNTFPVDFEWDTSKVWDAWNKVLQYCKTNYPSAKVGLIVDGSTNSDQVTVFEGLSEKYGCGLLNLQDKSTPAMRYNVGGVADTEKYDFKSKFSLTQLSTAKRKLEGTINYDIGDPIFNFYDHQLNIHCYDVLGDGTTYNPSIHSTVLGQKMKASIIYNWMLSL